MKNLIIPILFLFTSFSVFAQSETAPSNPNVRLGQKALLDGDFKLAATYLEKALPTESSDPNVLYMLGYAQYHSGDYQKALSAFGKVVEMKPDDERAYYYKGRLNNLLAVQSTTRLSTRERENLLNQAIADFTTGVSLNDEDVKLFQNRAIAYRDLGILLGTEGTDNYNKTAATEAYNNSVKDFEIVLSFQPDRKDIETEIRKAKIYRDNLK
ncbi:MAG TPA: tetratricopeptide repeat protein [Sphingobacteriaceae bacterium]|nr:tetratricopeptide repeat protein [Sphingobacteriaceae bacterium]